MRRFLGIIPARKGSKGLPGKNFRPLLGKPLVVWTVEAALSSDLDQVVCSTDDINIQSYLAGVVPVLERPAHLATDEASMVDVLLDITEKVAGFTDLVLLQPTSPLRNAKDLNEALKLAKENPDFSIISVSKSRKSPFWSYRIGEEGRLSAMFDSSNRRQTMEQTYLPNGAIYIVPIEKLKIERKLLTSHTLPFVMPPERSVDIDDEFDFKIAELLGHEVQP